MSFSDTQRCMCKCATCASAHPHATLVRCVYARQVRSGRRVHRRANGGAASPTPRAQLGHAVRMRKPLLRTPAHATPRAAHATPATRGQEMAEEAFDSLDEAAVAGAHGLGWGPLLSPIDVLSFGNMDALLKPQIPHAPVPLAPHSSQQHIPQHHVPVPLAPAPGPSPRPLPVSMTHAKRETRVIKRRAVPRRRPITGSSGAPSTPPALRRLSRAEEALEYGALADIGGTTAARSRQMSEEERRVMLYKRKLRNRASAARSREKRCRTIMELSKEVQALLDVSTKLRTECNERAAENDHIIAENKRLKVENDRLRDMLSHSPLTSTTQL